MALQTVAETCGIGKNFDCNSTSSLRAQDRASRTMPFNLSTEKRAAAPLYFRLQSDLPACVGTTLGDRLKVAAGFCPTISPFWVVNGTHVGRLTACQVGLPSTPALCFYDSLRDCRHSAYTLDEAGTREADSRGAPRRSDEILWVWIRHRSEG